VCWDCPLRTKSVPPLVSWVLCLAIHRGILQIITDLIPNHSYGKFYKGEVYKMTKWKHFPSEESHKKFSEM
jgi:hypothetical protein